MISRQAATAFFKRLGIRSRKLVEGIEMGEYRSAFRGQGMEFKGVRPYQWGDDWRQMDWNVTARMGEPYVKELMEERELTHVAVIDRSRSMEFGTKEKLKSESASEIATLLAYLAMSRGDRFGSLVYGGTALWFDPPGKGERRALAALSRLDRRAAGASSLENAVTYLSHVLKRRSHVFIVSDFFEPLPEKMLKIFSKRHAVFPFVVSDPAEWDLPDAGSILLSDAESGEPFLADSGSPRVRNAYRAERSAFYGEMRRKFSRLGMRAAFFSTATSTAQPFAEFLGRLASSR